ncbi:hypothetical protein [Pseudoxanthomonas sp. J35]|uniref:hypothetical protein n=1 Tax=Pseudoxanthomonas sp. J35 TaxID=935852 RepID=UPI00048C7AA1|nr:hypothetical protein [Pseudoxanthomonas sp. J35]
MPHPAQAAWRDELLPRVVAAGGSVLLLALGWKLASGLVPIGMPRIEETPRLRVVFSPRNAAPDLPVPPPAVLPAAPVQDARAPASPPPPQSRSDKPQPAPPPAAPRNAVPTLFGEDGRPRLPAQLADRWETAKPAPGGKPVEPERNPLERRNPVDARRTRFADDWVSDGDAAEVINQQIARAQSKIAEFLLGKDIQHARARPSPEVRFNPVRHERVADLGSEATGDAYKAAPIPYEPAPGLEGEASRRIREQVAALETAYSRCDRARLRRLMQPLLAHLDELQKAETAFARGADPVRARHMLPNVANTAYDMARRALWYADTRMAGCTAGAG